MLPLAAALSVLAALLPLSAAQSRTFLSAPEQTAVEFTVKTNTDPSALAPGYIFIAPFSFNFGYGPQIFDSDGHAVWIGNYTVRERAVDFAVCAYEGSQSDHLCYNDAIPHGPAGHSEGFVRWFDNTYAPVKTWGAINGLPRPDIHEFDVNVNPPDIGNTFIQDTYKTVENVDLTSVGGPKNGFALVGCFQDRETASGSLIFQWCSLAHVPFTESYLRIPANSAVGKTYNRAFDYFHINSICKDVEGNYLVSSRQTHTLYKIAGVNHASPGNIIYRIGGKKSDFQFIDGLNFAWQHHARVLDTTSTETTISVFNNNLTAHDPSAGIFFIANNSTMTARQTAIYNQPSGMISETEGSVQQLPNGNVFMGWGSLSSLSEHAEGNPGEALYYATFAANQVHSYRSWKFPWVGRPTTAPAVFAYAPTCNGPLTVYMSWNGATEIKGWRVFVADSANGTGSQLGGKTFQKLSFETTATVHPQRFRAYVYVEAVSASGTTLKRSVPTVVFVPNASLAVSCSATRCPPGTAYVAANRATCP